MPSFQLAGVLVFSAIPFTAVKAIANSSLGESLRRRLEEKKKEAVENTSRFNAKAQKARADRYVCLIKLKTLCFDLYYEKANVCLVNICFLWFCSCKCAASGMDKNVPVGLVPSHMIILLTSLEISLGITDSTLQVLARIV